MDTSKYKDALDTGNRSKIVAAAVALVKEAGGTPRDPSPTNVSANHGADNSAETKQIQKHFNAEALGLTSAFDAYNKRIASRGNASAELGVMVDQLQALQSADANLTEIERIEKGDAFGEGGGLPAPGVPPWAIALKAGVNRLLKQQNLEQIP